MEKELFMQIFYGSYIPLRQVYDGLETFCLEENKMVTLKHTLPGQKCYVSADSTTVLANYTASDGRPVSFEEGRIGNVQVNVSTLNERLLTDLFDKFTILRRGYIFRVKMKD